MNKVILTFDSCQTLQKEKSLHSKGFSPSINLPEDKVSELKELHHTLQEVFKIHLDEYTKNPRIRISRMAIAARIKCHPNHVSRLIAILVEKGFLFKWQPFGETNVTKIEDALTKPTVIKKLKYYFKLFAYFSTTVLVARGHVTQLILKEYSASRIVSQSRDSSVCTVLNVRTCTEPSNCTPVELLYLPERVPWVYNCTETGVPNTKMSDEEAERIFGSTKKRVEHDEFHARAISADRGLSQSIDRVCQQDDYEGFAQWQIDQQHLWVLHEHMQVTCS